MILIGLPPFLSPLVSFLVALVAALSVVGRRRQSFTINRGHDVEREIARITNKVRHPWTHWIR